MVPGAHLLRRLRLLVHTADPATGQALQGRFEAGLSRRLAEVVAAVCEELGPVEELLRLDRLDLPLGAFALEDLEREAPLALERALREALAQALAAARHNPAPGQRLLPPQAARLERFVTFLRLGVLPWRSAAEPFTPEEDLLALLQDDPAALVAALLRLAGERTALERLVLRLDSERFARLLAALAPAEAALILSYLAQLLRLHQQRPLFPVEDGSLRRGLWLVTLTLLLRDPGTPFNRRTFLDQLLRGLAAERRVAYSRLLRQLEDALRLFARSQPPSGSLPALLAELLGLRRSLAPALAIAPRDPEPLLALLRADPTNPELHRALEPRLSAPLFASLVRAIEPEQAPLVLATVDDVALVHRQAPLVPLAAASLERLVRRVALQVLLLPSGAPFERLSFLRHLLRQLAQSQRLVYADLLRTFAAALRRPPRLLPLQTSLPVLLDTLIAADLGDGAPGAEPVSTPGLPDPAGQADEARQTTAQATAAIRRPPPAFPVELWEAFLRGGHPAHLGLRLQEAVERDPARFVALLRALLASCPADPGLRGATVPGLQRATVAEVGSESASSLTWTLLLARLLRWLPPEALAALAAAASPDPHPPAVLLARWAEWLADAPGADLAGAWSQLLLQRLADPAAPLPALPALAASQLDRLALLRTWLGLESPLPWLAASAAPAAPATEPPAWAVPLLRQASELELRRLLQLSGVESTAMMLALRRLQRLLQAPEPTADASAEGAEGRAPAGASQSGETKSSEALDPACFDQLLERLLPWLRHPTGPLAEALSMAPTPAGREAVRLRAVAIALAGGVLTLEELRCPLPPLASSAPMEASAPPPADPSAAIADRDTSGLTPSAPDDRQRLLAWLAGEGSEVPAQLPTLLRLFVVLAERGDPALVANLRQGAGEREPRQRWRRQLPEALLGRVVLLLQPGRGRLLLDLQALLTLAWRQAALPGDPPAAELPWDTLLPLVATPRPLSTRWISDRLLLALCGGADRQQPAAERLLRRARHLASATGGEVAIHGALPLLAALEPPADPPPEAPSSTPPRATPPPVDDAAAIWQEALADGLYIANAGLVLFHPFLPRFFERLGVLTPAADDGPPAIAGLEDGSRAVHLLQWLVDERLDAPEPDLALNKVLAGLDLTTPILDRHPASAEELAIAGELLQAVLHHWPPLVNTSFAGLRETFLRREGRLELPTLDNNQWTLLVQRRTVDVLLDRMPWPITPLLHRWMAAPLHVTW
jgi:hypothetical protein